MPAIPYQLKVVKTISFFENSNTQRRYEENVRTVPIPTAFKTEDASSNCVKKSGDPNTYAVCTISNCKSQRKQDNFDARVQDCWQWNYRSGKPQMTHLDRMWTDKESQAYDFSGIKTKTETISSCQPINDGTPYRFHDKPCWNEPAEDKKKKQFFIKPHYTYYRSMVSVSDRTDCRMRIVGSYADGNVLLPGGLNEWDIDKHWQNPPTRRNHYYNIYPVFDGMQRSGFSGFHDKEDKTIARWDYTIPCEYSYNNMKRSTNVIYAESGCNHPACVDFITKPCYDNVYRYDEMVCTLIRDNFKQGPILFSTFKEKIVRLIPYREPFMSYGLFGVHSFFDIWYDTAKVQVKRDNTILDPNSNPHVFADSHTISVALISDTSKTYSCDACFGIDLFGRSSSNDNALENDIIPCRRCLDYEKVQITQSSRNYQDCVLCDPHHIRNPDQVAQCRKCSEIDPAKPMRRSAPYPQTDSECKTCRQFQYFDIATPEGCKFLPTVTDDVKVINRKVRLSGEDYYIQNGLRKEIEEQFWRDNRPENASWYADIKLSECTYGAEDESILVKRLLFRSWCGHQEMVRHDQAWVQVDGTTLYVPLNNDTGRTRSNTTVVDLCGNSTLKQVQGSTTADLECGQRQFKIVRSGFQDPCTRCNGTRYTKNCWPTYAPGLEIYDDQYFDPANKKTLVPQPGECAACNAKCDTANEYIDPVQYSCWWNGTGRIAGVLGATATNFSWYKPAPCTQCQSVKLAATKAELYLSCGNRVSYRRWLPDEVSDSTKTPARSIPSIQVCCAEPLTVKLCTDNELEFETFSSQFCRQSVDDVWPTTLAYCPPGWYVDETCARENTLWSPDCCVKCKVCRTGKFKIDAYYDCPGNEYFDSQDRGCTTSCLTNQYLRNERCIKCEACE